MSKTLTEEDGYAALRGHLVEKAELARSRYGPVIDRAALDSILADRDIVRFPSELRFDASVLEPGEFGWAEPLGDWPNDGYSIALHPHFADRPADVVALVAYLLVTVNYLDIANHEEAELFGAVLLGMEVDEFYQRICALADELTAPTLGCSTAGC